MTHNILTEHRIQALFFQSPDIDYTVQLPRRYISGANQNKPLIVNPKRRFSKNNIVLAIGEAISDKSPLFAANIAIQKIRRSSRAFLT